ncbi:MAG: nuclear transport factor 2 family protein [Chitinophagaceae bacterium]
MITTTINKQEEIRLTAVRWFEFMIKGDVEKLCAMTDPGWIINGGLPGLPPGPAGIRTLFENVGPVKQQWMINDIIAERDKVVVRATNRSIQDIFLEFKDHECRQVSSAIFIHKIINGKVVETWRNADDLGGAAGK